MTSSFGDETTNILLERKVKYVILMLYFKKRTEMKRVLNHSAVMSEILGFFFFNTITVMDILQGGWAMKYLNSYERALLQIQQELIAMGQLVTTRLDEALQAFLTQDVSLARVLMDGDDVIDAYKETIEYQALEWLSLQQPLDKDLRFLMAAIRIGQELERIGDYACDIADSVVCQELPRQWQDGVEELAGQVSSLLHRSLTAHFNKDLGSARCRNEEDDQVDRLFAKLLRQLLNGMKECPERIEQANALVMVVRYLERIGDRAVNISKMTIYAETGERDPFKSQKAVL